MSKLSLSVEQAGEPCGEAVFCRERAAGFTLGGQRFGVRVDDDALGDQRNLAAGLIHREAVLDFRADQEA